MTSDAHGSATLLIYCIASLRPAETRHVPLCVQEWGEQCPCWCVEVG